MTKIINHSRIFFILAIMLTVACAFVAQASESGKADTLRVGVFNNYPLIFEQKGHPEGFQLELLRHIASKENWTLDYKYAGSLKNVLQGLQNGTLDIAMGLASTPQREKFLDFTKGNSTLLSGQVFVKSGYTEIKTIKDLHGKKIGFVKQSAIGNNFNEVADKLGIKPLSISVSSSVELATAVMTGSVDAGIFNNFQGQHLSAFYSIQPTSIEFRPISFHFAVPKSKNVFITQKIDQHFDSLKRTKGSAYYELEDKYFQLQPSKATWSKDDFLKAFSLCLLFILFGVLLGTYISTEKLPHQTTKSSGYVRQIIFFSLSISALFWLADTFVEWMLFNGEQQLTLIELAITAVPVANLYIRGMFFLVCCFFGLFCAKHIRMYDDLFKILLANTKRFEELTDNARDMIFRMSLPSGEYEFVSKASLTIFGYSPENFYTSPLFIKKLIHPDWEEYFSKHWEELLSGNVPAYYEYQVMNKAGEVRWINQRNTLYCDASGKPVAIEGIVTDITEQKTALN